MSVITSIYDRLRHPGIRTGITRVMRLWDILNYKRTINPLADLTPQRARQLYDLYRRGQYADVMLAWAAIEEYDETLATVVDRRQTALGEMTWSIKIDAEAIGDDAQLRALANSQKAYLADAIGRVVNITDAVKHLGMASFRGYSHIEVIDHGIKVTWEPIDPWLIARPILDGRWMYNPDASTSAARLEEIDMSRVLMRTVARPIDLPCMFLVCAKAHAITGWDGFLDVFGNPAIFAKLPPGITDLERDEYAKLVAEIIGDGRGVYPDGTEIKTVETAAANGDTFSTRAEWCDRAIVRRATGGELTVLTAPDSGTLAGSAHANTFTTLAANDAASIAECINRQITRRLLATRYPGQPRLAYWSLDYKATKDVTSHVTNIVQLASAGYRITDEQASEITGLDLTSANMDSTAIYAAKAAGYVPTQTAMQTRMGMPLKPVPIDGIIDGEYVANTMTGLPGIVTNAAATIQAPPIDEPLTPEEIAALQALANARLDPAAIDAQAEAVKSALQRAATSWRDDDPAASGEAIANPLQNPNSTLADAEGDDILANKGPYKCGRPHCRGHRDPQQTPRKGTTRGNQTKAGSNTPLRAEPTAKARKKVDAVERAIRKTAAKGGQVRGAATISKSRLDIHGGQPGRKREGYAGGYGSSHQQAKHGAPPESTTPRKAARALVHGQRSKDKERGTTRHDYKSTQAITLPTGRRRSKMITAYKRKKPKS